MKILVSILSLAAFTFAASAADDLTANSGLLLSTASLSSKVITNGVNVTNVYYPAGKEITLAYTGQFPIAGASNVTVTVQKGIDGQHFDSFQTWTIVGNGTTAVTCVTNYTVNAIKALRVITAASPLNNITNATLYINTK